MTVERLIYLPLGGAGEVGMNAYVYGYGPKGRERLILVDLGVTFPDMDGSPGVDLILPDIAWLEERRDRLEAIFITHAHEDHVTALGHLWNRLKAPVYARNFTARIAQKKMIEAGQPVESVQTAEPRDPIAAGPFTVQFLPISHSLPEARRMLIETPAGRILHTGDFKLDLSPGVGEPFDEALLRDRRSGHQGAGLRFDQCLQHPSRPVGKLAGRGHAAALTEAPGMVVATTFASNVARLRTHGEGARASRAVGLPDGAGDAQHGAHRDRGGASARLPGHRLARRSRRHPAREPADPRHRQPGRTARGLGAAGARHLHGDRPAGGRHVPLFLDDHSGQ
jgi:ribonuclease J